MSLRQIIKLDGTVVNANLPSFSVSALEIAAANIPGLVAWPGLSAWAANTANTGFKDRIADATRLANGQNPVTGRFFSGPGGETSYSVQSTSMAIILPSFDMTGDMTIGVRFSPNALDGAGLGGIALGSYTGATNSWWLNTETNTGKLRFAFGAISSLYADYTGPIMAQGSWSYAVLSLSRSKGRARLRVNGTYEQILDNSALKTVTLLSELAVGMQNATGTAQERRGYYRKALAFNKYLEGQNLSDLEAYLAASAAD